MIDVEIYLTCHWQLDLDPLLVSILSPQSSKMCNCPSTSQRPDGAGQAQHGVYEQGVFSDVSFPNGPLYVFSI